MQSLAHRSTGDSRESRALELYRKHGAEIQDVGGDFYLVPSCTGSEAGFYAVDYRHETCDCPDHQIRRENCKHILAVGIHVAKRRATNGFPSEACACLDGWVFVGYEDEHGEEREASYRCRRCSQ